MNKTVLNAAVVVPSLAAAFFLGIRCGDGAKNQGCECRDRSTVAEPCVEPAFASGMDNAETSACSGSGQVRYAIEWSPEKENSLVNGQPIYKRQYTTCQMGSHLMKVDWEEPTPKEPKAFAFPADWGVAKPEAARTQPVSNRVLNSFNSPLDRVSLPRRR
jgi:hypothetical protein